MGDPSRSHLGPSLVGVVLFIVAGVVALSVDVPRTTYGLKSDESTYVAAALSAAYDGDLAFERRDLERFEGLYHSGPEGIFLKRGKATRVRLHSPFPFVHVTKGEELRADRLYFGKALVYPLAAAPFVRYFGLNGLLLLQVVLIGLAAVAAYTFLAAQSSPLPAAVFTSAFFGASALPAYGAFLMPEIFNFTLVMLAYFLWLYKEVSPRAWLSGRWTDVAAAVLLGVATYSKPLPTAVLVAPIVGWSWMRGRWGQGFSLGAVAVVVACACFAFNATVSGEFNYQGGDRKVFYGRFPMDRPDATWDTFRSTVMTDGTTAQQVLTSRDSMNWFVQNVGYFLAGRHFGFLPYYFPGAVAIVLWVLSRGRRDGWRLLIFAGFIGATVALLIVLPFTWSGGGGPPGNRYGLAAYPVLLFLIPAGISLTPGLVAWAGGALFTAKILAGPFVAAKFPYLLVEKGPARRLPVELTMANDLPVMLAQPLRGHVQYRNDPGVLLYFLDQNAWPPESTGVAPDGSRVSSIWVSGSGRAEIIVRAAWPIEYLDVEVESPIRTVLTLGAGSAVASVTVEPGRVQSLNLKVSGVRGFGDHSYLLTVHSTDGFVPHLADPASSDSRNLGAQIRFRPIMPSAGTPSPK